MRAASALALARRLLRDRCTFSDARWFCSTNAERGKTAKRPAHKPATLAANTKHITDHSDIPIEKLSLSRGLALNRFEKDFLIYPEYLDSESAANIKSFAVELRNDLRKALANGKPSNGAFQQSVLAVLKKASLWSAYVPAEYGGIGMCNKDLLCISEVLGIDWNVYMTLTQIQRAVKAITVYGTQEQKESLLPRIASGSLRPAICLFEENGGFDFAAMRTTSTASGGGVEKLNGRKNRVIGAANANLFFIFANRKSSLQDSDAFRCFLVEKDSLPEGALTVTSPLRTLGLNGLDVSTVELRDLSVTSANVLGSSSEGPDIALELSASNDFTYGAAVVGFLKLLTAELVHFCNTTVQYNVSLSENPGIQRLLTEMCLTTFVLESMSYYIGGLLDEELIIASDIEAAVIHKYANRALRLAISTTVEVLGTGSCDMEFRFEKMFRDAITVMSLSNAETNLTEQISMGTLTSWANTNAGRLSAWRSGKTGAFSRLFGAESDHAQINNPKLVHFIAEHAHPSLEYACRDLEQTMSRLNIVLGKVTAEQGKHLETDFAALCSISSVVENNLGMVAAISRASRSYSIGLRNADLEVAWALTYCSRAARHSLTELNGLLDYFGLVRFHPSLLQIGRAALDMGGYCLESPVEKNW
uniref:Acyl-CoA dehydrogenase family member 9 n=1 Tax=Ascaris suum TaxID=6253 RepID=F1KZ66_ASCSU